MVFMAFSAHWEGEQAACRGAGRHPLGTQGYGEASPVPRAPFSRPATEPYSSLGNRTDMSEKRSLLGLRQLGQPPRVPGNCFCLGGIRRAILRMPGGRGASSAQGGGDVFRSQELCHHPPSRCVDDSGELWPAPHGQLHNTCAGCGRRLGSPGVPADGSTLRSPEADRRFRRHHPSGCCLLGLQGACSQLMSPN